jgi:Schlafen, AlbA_2
MWRPANWEEIQAALGVAREGQALDFKDGRALKNGPEIARDIAAMSVFGGVLAYGIDEENEIAIAAPGVALQGQMDRLQQIVNANVSPPVFIEVHIHDDPDRSGHGVIVVVVPPSSTAPHAVTVNDKPVYPVRSGTTTRFPGEREIADLYARRASIRAEQASDVPLLAGMTMPPWMSTSGLAMTGVGVMHVVAAPAGAQSAPDDYVLGDRLRDAVAKANAAIIPAFISVPNSPYLLDREPWKPREARGWYSHRDEIPDVDFVQRVHTHSATYLYRSGFSYQVTMPTDHDGRTYIWDHIWAANLVGALGITAAFYAEDASAALLRVDVGITLYGTDEAFPEGPSDVRFRGEARKVEPYAERRILSLMDVRENPVAAAESLLARFLASIHPSGSNVFRRLAE